MINSIPAITSKKLILVKLFIKIMRILYTCREKKEQVWYDASLERDIRANNWMDLHQKKIIQTRIDYR